MYVVTKQHSRRSDCNELIYLESGTDSSHLGVFCLCDTVASSRHAPTTVSALTPQDHNPH